MIRAVRMKASLRVAGRSRCWELTGGAFDPTVQALWILYRNHFSRPGADPDGPPEPALREALARVGMHG